MRFGVNRTLHRSFDIRKAGYCRKIVEQSCYVLDSLSTHPSLLICQDEFQPINIAIFCDFKDLQAQRRSRSWQVNCNKYGESSALCSFAVPALMSLAMRSEQGKQVSEP